MTHFREYLSLVLLIAFNTSVDQVKGYDETQPMTPFNLPGPTADINLLGHLNITMDEIIHAAPTGGASCHQHDVPSAQDPDLMRQAVTNPNFLWNQGYINFQIDPQFRKFPIPAYMCGPSHRIRFFSIQ